MLQHAEVAAERAFCPLVARRPAKGSVDCRPDKWGMSRPIRGQLVSIASDGGGFLLAKKLEENQHVELALMGTIFGRVVTRAKVREAMPVDESNWEYWCDFERRLNYRELALFINWWARLAD